MDGIIALQEFLKVVVIYSKMVDNPHTKPITLSELRVLITTTIEELENKANSDFDSAMEGYPEE
jgi:hypothetical protein